MSSINVDNKFYIQVKDKDYDDLYYYIKIYIKDKEIIFRYSNLIYGKLYNTNAISYSIEELQLTNELFSLYNNIQEIFDVLKDIISNSYNNKIPPIINKKNNNFDLIFFVELGKIQTITISLKEKINVFVKSNEKIYEEIEEDISKLDSINKIIESYENEIKNLKNENSKLNNDIINLQKKLSQNLNKNKDNNNKNKKQKHNQSQKEHKTNSKNNNLSIYGLYGLIILMMIIILFIPFLKSKR